MKILTKTLLILSLLWLTYSVNAQFSPTVNITFRSKLAFSMGGANICGYAKNGREYALVGNYQGMAIVDVTNPTMPVLFQQVTGLPSAWREIKVYQDYAYVTTEADNSGLQIVDLTALGLATPMPTTTTTYRGDGALTNLRRIHALHIDEAKGFAYLFGGISEFTTAAGTELSDGIALVLDLKPDPLNPHYVGKSLKSFTPSNHNYIHDGYVRGDTLYSGNIYGGFFTITDFRDKTNPININTQRTPTTFNHNSWLSDDSKTLFTTDENQGSYLGAYDVSNPRDIKLLDKIRTIAGNNAIVHNTHIINDFAVTSWYTEGVTIVDAHRPQNLVQVGQYDTYGGSGTGFAGCWGVYPYLPSGNLITSNYTDTMFVLTPQYVRACYLEGTVTSSTTGLTLSGVLVKINSTDMDKKAESNGQGIYRTGQVTAETVSATYSKDGYISKTLTGIVLNNGVVTLQNVVLDPIIVPIELLNFQGIVEQNTTKLTWQTASEINVSEFKIEKLITVNNKENWTSIGTLKATNAPNNYVLTDAEPTKGTNYYRLKTIDLDGSFALSKAISVVFLDGKKDVFLYPNPVKNRVFLANNAFKDTQIVEILDKVGKVVLRSTIGQGQGGFDVQYLANGEYFLRIGEEITLKFTKFM
ncbi:MAG: choice-of-anchor B family protein [Saprospiraceae bacterium]|nr:choice-of-anchor B family protein [Saprospiraceae bacterium]